MHFLNEHQILIFLLQLSIIIILARSAGELFRRFKQPVLTAELLIGVLLGPTVFGRFFPDQWGFLFPVDQVQQGMLETVAWIGVLFLLLDTGLEIDFSSAWRQRGNALVIASSDIVIPMVIAFFPAMLLPDSFLVDPGQRVYFALFIAVVMTISAMPVASRVMHELKILKTDMGFLIMSALAVNDIVGWVLFTIIIGLFMQGGFNPTLIAFVFISTVGFSAFTLTAGRWLSNKTVDFFSKKSLPEPASSFTFACVLGLVFGTVTQSLGIHALFGFFLAGIVVGEAKNLKEETRTIISQMVHSLFIPVFFVNIGLKTDFVRGFDLMLVTVITCIGVVGRFIGAWIGVNLSTTPKINRALISLAHIPGGMMEIVVALLAFDNKLITEKVFVAIVFGAVFSSVILGPLMRAALKRRKDIPVLSFLKIDPALFGLHEGMQKKDTLSAMVALLPQYFKTANVEEITSEIFEREKNYSTAVGGGIAIPHVKIPGLADPVLLFARSSFGVDWNAPDGKDVHFIFFLFSPKNENDLHVQLLAKIIQKVQIGANRDSLLACDAKQLETILLQVFA